MQKILIQQIPNDEHIIGNNFSIVASLVDENYDWDQLALDELNNQHSIVLDLDQGLELAGDLHSLLLKLK